MARLEGKVALITGGTSGIGADTARLFSQEGAKVIIVGRSEEKGNSLANDLGKDVVYKKADITKEKDISGSVDFALEKFSKLNESTPPTTTPFVLVESGISAKRVQDSSWGSNS